MPYSGATGRSGFRLGIDLGTSHTVAVLGRPDGQTRQLLFDGFPLLPSAVFADPSGLLVGRDAVHAGRAFPERLELNPKRRIDDGVVLLGRLEVTVVDLFAAVLGRVLHEAGRVGSPFATVLTHPATWGQPRRQTLLAAAHRAGLPAVTLVAEPVAAAAYFAADLPDGSTVLVYDFGAGTFDASVVRRVGGSLAVVATRGLDDTGGLDIDAAVVHYLGSVYAPRHREVWRRLIAPVTAADRRASRQLWDDVRVAKESLSRLATSVVPIPLLDTDAPLGRTQLDDLAAPVVARTTATTEAVLRDAGVPAPELSGVFLVGGSSRLPLAATALLRTLRVPPTVMEQPEMVVAEGSLLAAPAPGGPTPARPAPVSTDETRLPTGAPPTSAPPTDAPPTGPESLAGRRPGRRRLLAGGAVAIGAGLLLSGDRASGSRIGRAAGLGPAGAPGAAASSPPGSGGAEPSATPSTPPAPGTLIWRTRLPGIRNRPAHGAGRLFVNCDNGTCYAINPTDGSTVWSRQVAQTTLLNDVGAPAVHNDRVYVPSHDRHLYSLDAATGTVVARAPSEQICTTAPLVDGGTVYLPQAAMEAYDPATLARRWLFDQPSSAGDAALADDLVVFSTNSALVHAVGRADGRQRWRYTPQGQTNPLSEAVAVDDGAVFVTGDNGDCYAIDLARGGLRWRRPVGHSTAPPAAAGGLVFTARDSDVYASGTRDGATRWKATIGAAFGPLTVAAGLVFVCGGTEVVALRAASGAVAWRYPLARGHGVRYADGVAYVGARAGDLVAIASPAEA